MDSHFPQQVKIVEVGPRDGLQNESSIIDTQTKVQFINQLAKTGLTYIEASSFVNPQRIPQLADADLVFETIERQPGRHYLALVPNMRGMERALQVNVDTVAVFTAVSETFCQKNIRCSVKASLQRFEPVIEAAKMNGKAVRAYISCVLGCPYEGDVQSSHVATLAQDLVAMGCDEISLGDTIGLGTPLRAREMLLETANRVELDKLAIHFHDTRGQALVNIFACLALGVSTIDASVAGLGGCPYAPGATGNVATEDVVYMLHGMGIETGVDLKKLIAIGHDITHQLGRVNQSRVGLIGV